MTNLDQVGVSLLGEALAVAGTQVKLAEVSDVSQSCVSIALSTGHITIKLLRRVSKGIRRKNKALADRIMRHADARANKT